MCDLWLLTSVLPVQKSERGKKCAKGGVTVDDYSALDVSISDTVTQGQRPLVNENRLNAL